MPGGLTPQQKEKLVNDLLGVRRIGPPPFLVRNLKYVKEHRARLLKEVWDLSWVVDDHRGTVGTRKLSLSCTPKRCVLPDALLRRFQKKGAAPNTEPHGRARLWLSAETTVGENIAFSVRETTIRIWGRTHVMAGGVVDDLMTPQVFDLSAVCAFLDCYPSRLSLVFELYTLRGSASLHENPVLRGEQVLIDRNVSLASAVPNRDFTVVLSVASKATVAAKQPAMGMTQKPSPVVTDMEDATSLLPMGFAFENDEELAMENLDNTKGVVTLSLIGSLGDQDAVDDGRPHAPHILVECVYTAPEFPWWNGITRHDFICPWCHRNCRRLRTLLFHFHLDHDKAELQLEAISKPREEGSQRDPQFVLNLSITPVGPLQSNENEGVTTTTTTTTLTTTTTSTTRSENVMVNKLRFPKYPTHRHNEDTIDELDMTKCCVADDANSDSTEEDETSVALRQAGWSKCVNCCRVHHRAYPRNTRFCGEYCEMAHSNADLAVVENVSTGSFGGREDDTPLSRLHKRKSKIDFKKALGDKTLYHVVSLTPFLEEHFDEDGADSEDEIDHSWRLRIVEDKLASLDGACAKNRVLWTMWNRYAHENYPAPGAYAERYTRYSAEKFVLEYSSEILRLKLRLQLVAFLRILHVHGCIDSEAFISVMLCLDGKKRLKQCAISSRPEISPGLDPKYKKSRKANGKRR